MDGIVFYFSEGGCMLNHGLRVGRDFQTFDGDSLPSRNSSAGKCYSADARPSSSWPLWGKLPDREEVVILNESIRIGTSV